MAPMTTVRSGVTLCHPCVASQGKPPAMNSDLYLSTLQKVVYISTMPIRGFSVYVSALKELIPISFNSFTEQSLEEYYFSHLMKLLMHISTSAYQYEFYPNS